MSDEDALLATIAADPAADTPRLVYADWLDDHADPRAEYVRLEVERHRLRPSEKNRRADLTAKLEALRPLAELHRLSRIDRVTRYSFYWPQAYCRAVRRDGRVGRPLDRIEHRGNATSYLPSSFRVGDYVYPVSHHAGTLHLNARMRVSDIIWVRGALIASVVGSEGTPVALIRPVPAEFIARLGWYSGRKEKRPGLNPDGEPVYMDAIQRTLRLTPTTAADFDAVLRDG